MVVTPGGVRHDLVRNNDAQKPLPGRLEGAFLLAGFGGSAMSERSNAKRRMRRRMSTLVSKMDEIQHIVETDQFLRTALDTAAGRVRLAEVMIEPIMPEWIRRMYRAKREGVLVVTEEMAR